MLQEVARPLLFQLDWVNGLQRRLTEQSMVWMRSQHCNHAHFEQNHEGNEKELAKGGREAVGHGERLAGTTSNARTSLSMYVFKT